MKQIRTILLFTLFLTLGNISLTGGNILYNEKDLSSSLTTAMTQDSEGYIWIGTEYGLNRYDGVSFKAYHNDENNPFSIKSNIVRSLYSDSKGRLWVGYLNGIQIYDPKTDSFRTVSFEDEERTLSIQDIYELSSGKIWANASKLGVFEIDIEKLTASPVSRLSELCGTENFLTVYEDNNNRIWITTTDKGLICVDSGLTKVIDTYFTEQSYLYGGKIVQNKDNIIIVSFGQGLWMYDEVHKEFVRADFPKNTSLILYDLLCSRSGDIIVTTYGQGIWKLDEDTRSVERYNIGLTEELDIERARVVRLMEDRDGNLWLGSFQQGVMMIPYKDENSFHQWEVGTPSYIYKSADGHIWCGTQNGYLYKMDDKGNILHKQRESAEIRCVTEDSMGNLWMAVRHSNLYKIDQKTGRRTTVDVFKSKTVTDIVENGDRTLFIAVSGEGIWKYDLRSDKCEKLTDSNTGNMPLFTNSNINKLLCDSKGRIWIGHYLGISCYDTDNQRFVEIPTDPVLSTSVCYALAETSEGNLLIGSNNGLFIWLEKEGKYIRHTTKDGLSSNMICGVGEDLEGNIWCSTFRGINSLDKDHENIVSWYGYNGASNREYIRNCYHSDGTSMYFGNLSGITKFETPIISNETKDIIKLTGFHIGNQEIPSGSIEESINLHHTENTFTLGLSPMRYTEDATRIHYRLRGLDESWNSTRYGINQVTYNNIKPGKYVFEAYAEENGIRSETYSLNIRVRTPWHRSIVAILFYIFISGVVVTYLMHSYKRNQRELANSQRLNHYINLAHEIRTPMVMITNPIETLLKNSSDRDTVSTLMTMKRNSERITRTLDQLLEIRRLDAGNMSIHRKKADLVKLIKGFLDYFTYQAKKKNISLRFEHSAEEIMFSVDTNHMDTILYNLIGNSIKYTPEGGEIIVKATLDNTRDNAVISVTDSGTGIDEKNVKNIFKRFYQDKDRSSGVKGFGIGLNLCQMLVKLHGGTITASNRKERSGAVFTITIPTLAHEKEEKIIVEQIIKDDVSAENPVTDSEAAKKIKPKKSDKILIVDDDEEIRIYLEEQLSHMYKVLTASDGDAGISKALTEIPDLIISDIRMPGTDGYGLLKTIKSNPNTTHIPVILLTAKNDLDDKLAGLEYGADSYISKPFHMTELKSIIENLLKNRQRIRGKFSGAYQEDKIKEIELESDNEILMKKVMKVINDNLDNTELKVEMLSMEIGLSRVQLHRKMKEITGISTGEFIRNIRLKKAAELLSEKKVNVSQVAYMVGFSSHTHFSTVFRKFYGVSPTEYINNKES